MKMSSYKSRPKTKYNVTPGAYIEKDESEKKKRRSFKQWLRDYLKEEDNFQLTPASLDVSGQQVGFNKSFEGWNIRLHRANGGHIVEAWKNEDVPHHSSYKPQHELFMVEDSADMGEKLNEILVQLMLRG